ncbi:MAG TPA: hypothetical protein VJ327_04300 [Patescibacteria group bacterium]|uniref:Uncharacterized protein n=1 Tax=Candidatus Amesbacteria bacterium RIFCSPLOWO2_01_FULL_48_25 TaxID=1797259 RepID=A0A1F4ZCB6_9BACT|nr:MAG: hypothetical protein A2989_04110 [Candidatus Amesbacteria bacterium RIFCSPLOWO2_01_FULL_48_25]HJZ05063.1 hypothetical protein [Patescibacteria group bacterium]
MNRRDFITGKWMRDLVSGPGRSPEGKAIDNAVEIGGEAAAVALMLLLAYQGSRDRLVWYEMNAPRVKGSPNFEKLMGSVDRLGEVIGVLTPAVSSLEEKWKSKYYKSKTETYIVIVDNKPEVRFKTVWYWDEPRELKEEGLHHDSLKNWREFGDGFGRKVNDLAANGSEAYDLERGTGSISYTGHEQDAGTQNILAGLGYGLVGGAYALYEEFDEWLSGIDHLPVFKASSHMKRRTFLKLAAAAGAYPAVRWLQNLTATSNKALLGDIQENSANVIKGMDVEDEEAFRRQFGVDPVDVGNHVLGVQKVVNAALDQKGDNIERWDEIRPLVKDVQVECERAGGKFLKFFDVHVGTMRIPVELTKVSKYLWATRQLKGYVEGRQVGLDTRHLWNAGFLGLGLAGVMALGEFGLFPVIDRAMGIEE